MFLSIGCLLEHFIIDLCHFGLINGGILLNRSGNGLGFQGAGAHPNQKT